MVAEPEDEELEPSEALELKCGLDQYVLQLDYFDKKVCLFHRVLYRGVELGDLTAETRFELHECEETHRAFIATVPIGPDGQEAEDAVLSESRKGYEQTFWGSFTSAGGARGAAPIVSQISSNVFWHHYI